MELLLEGKAVSESIKNRIQEKIKDLTEMPKVAVLTLNPAEANLAYINKIEKNCSKYKIGFELKITKTEKEFINELNKAKQNDEITGIMCQQPLPKSLFDEINTIPLEKDIEGITHQSLGKVFVGEKNVNIPCTSKAVIETLDFYNIDLTGKNVVVVGRSNIVGKPLIPQLLAKNATVTVCHSKTQNIEKILQTADVIIMAIGRAKFLKKEMIKKDAILIDVGINFENGKICGDIDFEDVKDKAYAVTPVPGGIGVVTNALLIENIINSVKKNP